MSDKPLISQILNFLAHPNKSYDEINKKSFFEALKFVVQISALNILIATIIITIQNVINSQVGFNNKNLLDDTVDPSPVFTVATVVILAPLVEELAFRLLITLSKTKFLIGSFSFSFFVLTSLPLIRIPNLPIALNLIAIILVFIATVVAAFRIKKEKLEVLLRKYLGVIIYGSTIAFGLVHITNYPELGNFWWLTPILVLPQIVIGFVCVFTRVKFGIVWAIVGHGFYNFLVGISNIGLLLAPNQDPDPSQIYPAVLTKIFSSEGWNYYTILGVINLIVDLIVFGITLQCLIEFYQYKKQLKLKPLEA